MFWKWKKKAPEKVLFGHDLAEWNFLGLSKISLNDESAWIALFVDKDLEERSWCFTATPSKYMTLVHAWPTTFLPMWASGEYRFFDHVRNDPSRWLKDHMMETYKHVWDEETQWWKLATESQKFSAAKKKQEKVIRTDPEHTVIEVDFKNKS